jgi:glycine cleavage system transcriptional repressor
MELELDGPATRFAVAVMGQDRPGIVAEVTGALLELRCNLADVATSILSGHFAMMMIFAAPAGTRLEGIRAALDPVTATGAIAIGAWEVTGSMESVQATHVASVYGPDRPGIVHAVAETLAGLGVNICDMVCRTHDDPAATYTLTVEVRVPDEVSPERVGAALRAAAGALGFDSSLRPLDEQLGL